MSILLTSKQRNKIKRAIKALNDVRRELQSENGECEIQWYLEDSNNLNLMSGDSHNETRRNNGAPMKDRVIDLFYLEMSSGGGW